MNAELSTNDAPPVIVPEGRFFRVSQIRAGKVESYLCETEAEARRFAELLSQPVVDPRARAHRPNATATKTSALQSQSQSDSSNVLRFVRVTAPNWKGK